MANTTESSSHYQNLELMTVDQILQSMNTEDQLIPLAVGKVIPEISRFVTDLVERMKRGGRLFYIGAGTSGRLGVVDASECPPTFGVPYDWVIGIIAGGDGAIRRAVEFAEDNQTQAWEDIKFYQPSHLDTVVGIAASGATPYVLGGLVSAKQEGLLTAAISCNKGSKIGIVADHAIEVEVGPEFLTGSTRLKSGTAQKLILNMITTSAMIQLGRVKGNKMVDMQLTNKKLVKRGVDMITDELGVSVEKAKELLEKYKSVRAVILNEKKG